VPGQTRDPAAPAGRAVNRILIDPPLVTDRLRVVTSRADGGAVGITALQLWRRTDPALTAGFAGLRDGAVPVDAGRTVTVRTRITATRAVAGATASLAVPRGWTARPVTTARAGRLRAGETFGTTWQVTVPPGADVTSGLPVRVLATSGSGVSAAAAPARYFFDPADFPVTVWDDDFGTDRTAAYRLDRPVPAEPAPDLSVAGGALTARATGRAFGVLAAPVTASPDGTAVIVTPKSFAGSAPEDSLFAGLSASAGDNALAWYNNHFGTSGADVRRAGANRPDAAGSCCAEVRWQPGDRFAAVVRGGRLSTWHERAGAWRPVHDAPIGAAADDATLAGWNPAVGLRLDPGAISLDQLTVRTRS
jgi:hypothetical protein